MILRIDRTNVLGYVFSDHIVGNKKKTFARLIAFDYHLKNLQFSFKHTALPEFKSDSSIGTSYNAIKIVKGVYGGSFLARPLRITEEKKEEPNVLEEG